MIFGVFLKIFTIGSKIARGGPLDVKIFYFFMQFLDMPKNAKIGPKKISGWPPPPKWPSLKMTKKLTCATVLVRIG